MAKWLSLTFLQCSVLTSNNYYNFYTFTYATPLQKGIFTLLDIHTPTMLTFHRARTGLHVKCNFPLRYKLRTLRKQIQGCNKVLFCCFCKTRPRVKETCHNLLFMDLKQEVPFHTTNIEWTWAISKNTESFFGWLFSDNQLQFKGRGEHKLYPNGFEVS